MDSFDREKVIGYLFDPDVSSILSELESGGRDSAYLSKKLDVPGEEIRGRLSYLIEHGFVDVTGDEPAVYTANAQKLTEVMEHDENFQSAVDGMTKLDGFLN